MKQNGFTLIEVLIVVAIVGVLVAIALPQYQVFTAKSKRTEATMALKTVFIAQRAYFAEFDTYPHGTGVTGPTGAINKKLGLENQISLKFYQFNSTYFLNPSGNQIVGYWIGMIANLDRDDFLDFIILKDNPPTVFVPALINQPNGLPSVICDDTTNQMLSAFGC